MSKGIHDLPLNYNLTYGHEMQFHAHAPEGTDVSQYIPIGKGMMINLVNEAGFNSIPHMTSPPYELQDGTKIVCTLSYGVQRIDIYPGNNDDNVVFRALFYWRPVHETYPQAIIYEDSSAPEGISIKFTDTENNVSVKAGNIYFQYPTTENKKYPMLSVEYDKDFTAYRLDCWQYLYGTTGRVYLGGYKLLYLPGRCLGAAYIAEKSLYCFVYADYSTRDIIFLTHPVIGIDYTNTDFDSYLISSDDCTEIGRIPTNIHYWYRPSTSCTFTKDGSKAIFSDLNGWGDFNEGDSRSAHDLVQIIYNVNINATSISWIEDKKEFVNTVTEKRSGRSMTNHATPDLLISPPSSQGSGWIRDDNNVPTHIEYTYSTTPSGAEALARGYAAAFSDECVNYEIESVVASNCTGGTETIVVRFGRTDGGCAWAGGVWCWATAFLVYNSPTNYDILDTKHDIPHPIIQGVQYDKDDILVWNKREPSYELYVEGMPKGNRNDAPYMPNITLDSQYGDSGSIGSYVSSINASASSGVWRSVGSTNAPYPSRSSETITTIDKDATKYTFGMYEFTAEYKESGFANIFNMQWEYQPVPNYYVLTGALIAKSCDSYYVKNCAERAPDLTVFPTPDHYIEYLGDSKTRETKPFILEAELKNQYAIIELADLRDNTGKLDFYSDSYSAELEWGDSTLPDVWQGSSKIVFIFEGVEYAIPGIDVYNGDFKKNPDYSSIRMETNVVPESYVEKVDYYSIEPYQIRHSTSCHNPNGFVLFTTSDTWYERDNDEGHIYNIVMYVFNTKTKKMIDMVKMYNDKLEEIYPGQYTPLSTETTTAYPSNSMHMVDYGVLDFIPNIKLL